MIWFNLKEIERKIAENDISEKESISYYLGIFLATILYAIIVSISTKKPISPQGSVAALHYFLNGVISVLGVLWAYRLNSKIDDIDFFIRFFSISFVIFIRLIIYTACIGIILLVFISMFIKFQDMNYQSIGLLAYASQLWKIIFYILIALSFHRISKLKSGN